MAFSFRVAGRQTCLATGGAAEELTLRMGGHSLGSAAMLKHVDAIMKRPFVTIILAGGKGTRMGTSDKHKVCFEVLGVPVIIRALETYNLCGAMLNVVVVGSMAESVMATVNRRFPGTPYAFQDKPLGTGDAARKGAELLERMRFDGNVLVVAGDKVIDPKVIRQLLAAHEQSGADVTLATAKRPPNSSAGILLKSPRGNIVGILEEAERRRLVALAKVSEAFARRRPSPRDDRAHPGRTMRGEDGAGSGAGKYGKPPEERWSRQS